MATPRDSEGSSKRKTFFLIQTVRPNSAVGALCSCY